MVLVIFHFISCSEGDFDLHVLPHANNKEGESDVDLHIGAQEVLTGKGDDKSQGLPQAIVCKACFGIFCEEKAVQG